MIQQTVLITTFALMAIVFGVFAYVAFNTKNNVSNYSDVQATAYRIRSKFFWILLIAGLLILYFTTRTLPYAATHGAQTANFEVDVEGKQWYWQLSKNSAKVNQTVVFNVTSGDVNHGFGIYDNDLRLLGQTQAMPGYENKLIHIFKKPGEYKLMCMEYCGLAHHVMISAFNVTSE